MLLRVIPICKRHLYLRPSYIRATADFRCVTPCSLMPIDQITVGHIPKSGNNSNYRSKDLPFPIQYEGECDALSGCGLQTHL